MVLIGHTTTLWLSDVSLSSPRHLWLSRKHFPLFCLEVCEVSRSSGADVRWCASRCLWEIMLSRPLVWLDVATLPFTACEIITLLIGPDLPINGKSDALPQPLKAADSKLLARFRKRLDHGELFSFFMCSSCIEDLWTWQYFFVCLFRITEWWLPL